MTVWVLPQSMARSMASHLPWLRHPTSMSKAMSSAGADCVITLVEITSAPASANGADVLERDATGDLDRNQCGAELRTSATHVRDLVGVMLSRSTMVAPALTASSTCASAVALDLDRAARPLSVRSLHRGGDGDAGEVVVLQEHEVGQRAAVVHSPAGAHRGLLQRTQAGQRLAGVEHPHPVAGGVHEPAGGGGDARQVAEEVERGALAGEQRPQRAAETEPILAPGPDGPPSSTSQSTCTVGSSWANTSVAHAVPATHAFAAHDDIGDGRARRAARARR